MTPGKPRDGLFRARESTIAALFLVASPASAAEARPDFVGPGFSVYAPGPTARSCPSEASRIEAGESIEALVDAAPAKTSFCIGRGIHRGETIAPKDGQRFFGEPGAVLNGSRLLVDFRREGAVWIAEGQTQQGERRGTCLPEAPACDRPEAVFVDGVSLTQVASRENLATGRFYFDYDRHRILLADDPAGHMVEASVAAYAFLSHGARDVTVSNLTIEKYGNPAQRGVVFDDQDASAQGWLVEHNEVRLNSGLAILAGPRSIIRANLVHDNGQLGISLSLDHIMIEDNVIAHNNTGGFDPAWEGGGLKGALASDVVIRRNDVRHNKGPGLWCDIECRNITYEDNLVEFNEGAGIFHEISYDATIRGNRTNQNGTGAGGWYWGANILVAASENVLVEDNDVTVADDGAGIALVDQGRERNGGADHYRTAGNRILRNTVRFLGRSGRMGGVSDVAPGTANDGMIEAGRNLFDDNLYLFPRNFVPTFAWGERAGDLEDFRTLGQERAAKVVIGAAQTP